MNDPRRHRPDAPLTTDALLRDRVRHLLPEASRRRLWLMFLSDDRTMSEVIMPCEGLPTDPDEAIDTADGRLSHVDALTRTLGRLVSEVNVAAFVFVWERPGGPAAAVDELRWARALAASCRRGGMAVAGQFLAHDTGVRSLHLDDGPDPAAAVTAA